MKVEADQQEGLEMDEAMTLVMEEVVDVVDKVVARNKRMRI